MQSVSISPITSIWRAGIAFEFQMLQQICLERIILMDLFLKRENIFTRQLINTYYSI